MKRNQRSKTALAPRAGFEPATQRLTAACSTTELPGNGAAYSKAPGDLQSANPVAFPRRCTPGIHRQAIENSGPRISGATLPGPRCAAPGERDPSAMRDRGVLRIE